MSKLAKNVEDELSNIYEIMFPSAKRLQSKVKKMKS